MSAWCAVENRLQTLVKETVGDHGFVEDAHYSGDLFTLGVDSKGWDMRFQGISLIAKTTNHNLHPGGIFAIALLKPDFSRELN